MRRLLLPIILVLGAALTLAACGDDDDDDETPASEATTVATATSEEDDVTPMATAVTTATATEPAANAESALELTSTAFEPGGAIPEVYTCDGENVSPPLAWSGAPEGTAAFALLMDDPDAPNRTFDHWVVYDVPAEQAMLEERIPPMESLPDGSKQGRNGTGEVGYLGPCPPEGSQPHRYSFRLYALDAPLGLEAGAGKSEVEAALEGHILAETELIGTYGR